MNISELARRLNVSPQELRDQLPKLGFDIGKKAIKIDERTAYRVISDWKKLSAKLKRIQMEESEKETENGENKEIKGEIKISDYIIVKELARKMQMPVTQILAVLF